MRMEPDERRAGILSAAMAVAEKNKLHDLSRTRVAEQAQCSKALVSHYFGTMGDLQDAVIRQAIKDGNVTIVAHGLAAGHRLARRAPAELKQKALARIAS